MRLDTIDLLREIAYALDKSAEARTRSRQEIWTAMHIGKSNPEITKAAEKAANSWELAADAWGTVAGEIARIAEIRRVESGEI